MTITGLALEAKELGEAATKPSWFVGGSDASTNDQLTRFLAEGIWESQYEDRQLDVIRSMRAGDRIAIKSSYTSKDGLPFDNRGQLVPVMAINAVGIITENLNDGKRVRVDWKKAGPASQWYFYTNRKNVWRVLPGEWMTDALNAFVFDGKAQDIDRFRNAPSWRERFGTDLIEKGRFDWTRFYEAVADKLLTYRRNRPALIAALREISTRVEGLGSLAHDKYADGTTGFVNDICPFTTMGLFNRGLKESNRRAIAGELAKFLGVTEPVPDGFDGLPVLNMQKSWYFPWESERNPDHIEALWDVFAAGIRYADSYDSNARLEFAQSFDRAMGRTGVAWNLTFGLYWIRPWAFLSLDGNSRVYLSKKLSVSIGTNAPKKRCNSADYLTLMDAMEPRFQEDSYPVHSYPELSREAWFYKDPVEIQSKVDRELNDADVAEHYEDDTEGVRGALPIIPYSVEQILEDGCFFDKKDIAQLLDRLRTKKNLILQGPPGTGKTWLAKRLAFALMGQKDESKVRSVQFHPNLTYEDFVRGWRPTGEGKLTLVDGVFLEAIKAALNNPHPAKIVVVIEEINRGNPAQIFGELLTLLEDSKRTPNEALELCYPDADGTRRPVHIPENLYVIGTMNVADRSLALVDLALRRRFAFVTLEPKLNNAWRNWVVKERNIEEKLVADIEHRILELNTQIASDERLGKQFRIGHSYVTPWHRLEDGETQKWFRQIVETEIGPLLDEYWFDEQKTASDACKRLLAGW